MNPNDNLRRGLTEAVVAVGYGSAILIVLAATYYALKWVEARL